MCIVVILCVFVVLLCIAVFTLDAGLLARSQYSEGPATGHLDTGFSWFSCAQKQMLRWCPRYQVATTCFSCSPPDLNLVVTNFMFCLHVKYPLPTGDNPIAVNKYYYLDAILYFYYWYYGGRDSSVGIPTCYRLDGPGVESMWGARFSSSVHTGPVAHPASYTLSTGSFPGVKRPEGRGVDHPPPCSAEGKERVELYLYSTSGPSWPVVGRIFPFTGIT